MKNRVVRVSELLQRELGAMITRDHAFPDVLVTVNDIEMSPDLRHAVVFIGVIGPEHRGQQVVDALNLRHGDYQTRLSRRVVLKNTPRLHFRLDRSVERGVRVTGIMEMIDRQLAESAARESAESAPADEERPRTTEE